MAHSLLSRIAAQRPATARLRARAPRRLAPIRPSRADELWYRHALGLIVGELKRDSNRLVEELRPTWQRVAGDAAPGGFHRLFDVLSRKFGDVDFTARQLAKAAAMKNLGVVDERLAAMIKKSIGVDLRGLLTAHGRVRGALERATVENVALIKSIPPEHLAKVREAVEDYWTKGTRWEALAKRVQEIGDITGRRAKIIARDQTAKMNAGFNAARQLDMGITEYRWRGALDQRERPSHRAMEGVLCKWASPPMVDGEAVNPGESILCRCVGEPILYLDNLQEAA